MDHSQLLTFPFTFFGRWVSSVSVLSITTGWFFSPTAQLHCYRHFTRWNIVITCCLYIHMVNGGKKAGRSHVLLLFLCVLLGWRHEGVQIMQTSTKSKMFFAKNKKPRETRAISLGEIGRWCCRSGPYLCSFCRVSLMQSIGRKCLQAEQVYYCQWHYYREETAAEHCIWPGDNRWGD